MITKGEIKEEVGNLAAKFIILIGAARNPNILGSIDLDSMEADILDHNEKIKDKIDQL